MNITSLLNPETVGEATAQPSISQTSLVQLPAAFTTATTSATHNSTMSSTTNVPRMPIIGVNFPASRILSGGTDDPALQEISKQHKKYLVALRYGGLGDITEYSKRVPYSSKAKPFLASIGRHDLETFQYSFRNPKDGIERLALWDYNIGLVRLTAFFKALGHNKTAITRALGSSPDVLDKLSLSVLGGAIDAQGYWVPFEIARELCKRFCYEIRWVLTPMFGEDFVHQCIPPGHPDFKNFVLDRHLVQGTLQHFDKLRQQAAGNRTQRRSQSEATKQGRTSTQEKYSAALARRSKTGGIKKQSKTPTKRSTRLGRGAPVYTQETDEEMEYQTELETAQNRLIESPPVSPKTVPVRLPGFRAINQVELAQRPVLSLNTARSAQSSGFMQATSAQTYPADHQRPYIKTLGTGVEGHLPQHTGERQTAYNNLVELDQADAQAGASTSNDNGLQLGSKHVKPLHGAPSYRPIGNYDKVGKPIEQFEEDEANFRAAERGSAEKRCIDDAATALLSLAGKAVIRPQHRLARSDGFYHFAEGLTYQPLTEDD